MRMFIAVNPGEQFRQRLATQLDAWRQQLQISWSRPQTWHLTLDFLGEVPDDRIESLADGLAATTRTHAPFAMVPGDLGAFPNLSRPRVLFLLMHSGGSLAALAGDVRDCVDRLLPGGQQDRKPFRPHLTIARIKRPLPRHQLASLRQIQFLPWESLTIDRIHLVASELHPAGARHTDKAVLTLGAGS